MTKEFEFDPVKRDKGGKEAEAVIWSCSVLEKAVDAMKKGLPLKANPFIGKNTKLLKPDLVFKRTQEEIEDYMHCMEDPLYFATKCYLMTPTGLQPVILRDYQEDYMRHLQQNRFSLFLSCRQSGKCFLQNTTVKFLFTNSFINNYGIQFGKQKFTYLFKNFKYVKSGSDYLFELPFYEFQNLFDDTTFWKLKYNIYKKKKYHAVEVVDWLEYNFVFHKKLLDNCKTTKEIDISEYRIKVLTDVGYQPISYIYNTKPFAIYKVILENGYSIECADKHMLFDNDLNIVYADELVENVSKVMTDRGPSIVKSVSVSKTKVSMCDVSINHPYHRYYTNGILSHNSTTTAIFCLWSILFRNDRNALILSKSGPAGQDLIKKIKDMYLYLPYHLKLGTLKWNQSEIAFDNNSTISTEAFSPTAGLGKTINFLILDEFAWCPPNDVELFYNNILPTVTADTSSNICIMSTQNGFNLFYKLWHAAETGKSMYAPFKVDWWQVPQWDPDNNIWKKRDNGWKAMMVGVLGSEEAFYYQYGTQFSASDKCLVSRECLGKIRDLTYLFETPTDDSWYFSLHKTEFKFKKDYDLRYLKIGWFIILVDLAEGGGNDFTTFNIIEVIGKDKFEQIGYWHCNTVDLEQASLEFWVLYGQLFNPNKTIVSVEWNTYGALFYNYLKNLNEPEYMPEASWRWQVNPLGEFDLANLIRYKKGSQEDNIANLNGFKNSKTIPGIRLSHATKISACALLKMMLEKFDVIITDLLTVSELENFEDKNGNGSYAAAYGHDDLIMTFVQLPLLKNTTKYKDFMEEWEIEMKATGQWEQIEKEESEMKKLDMLKKIADMMSNVLQKKKEEKQITVSLNDRNLPTAAAESSSIYRETQSNASTNIPNMYTMYNTGMQQGLPSMNDFYGSPNGYGNEPTIYDMPGQYIQDPLRARFRQFN
jgi:hypothetical protein